MACLKGILIMLSKRKCQTPGIIRDGYPVTKGFKIADIDPREGEKENCDTISDKARCIAGGVLEAVLRI